MDYQDAFTADDMIAFLSFSKQTVILIALILEIGYLYLLTVDVPYLIPNILLMLLFFVAFLLFILLF